ncbi:MAG TPA: FG-GAP-like repeat-containing protein, partial [Pyrinomonadaceae bacterium]|nr:FG-GAP-like repeat-containing protein [Pyrinomonadaceae bacterium]
MRRRTRNLLAVVAGSILLSVVAPPPVMANLKGPGKIAFVSVRDGNADIYAIDPDGTGEARLTYDGAYDSCPAWSPDGRRIAFIRSSGNGISSIFIMNADGSNQIEGVRGIAVDSCLSWSPDGEQMAFSNGTSIYTVNIDGTGLRNLGTGMSPAWSPDGTTLAFSRWPPVPAYGAEIYTMDTSGGSITRLTVSIGYPGFSEPSWSPDGTEIACAFDFDFGGQNSGIGIIGGNLAFTTLLTTNYNPTAPSWSLNGNQLVFNADPTLASRAQIWRINRDGSGMVQVTTGAGGAGNPDWQHAIPPPTKLDFDGDGRSDPAVFRPSGGNWYINGSRIGPYAQSFGLADDRIVPADFDGDGKTDIAVFRSGVWYWLNSSDSQFNTLEFGQPSDLPVPADFTGDGRAEPTIYRDGVWWALDLSNGQVSVLQFGLPADKPVVGDYDGDGNADQAIYRNGEWHLNLSASGYTVVQFGLPSDKPVASDYDGDGKTDEAVYRDGIWYVLQSTRGIAQFQFGLPSDIPAPADYDGDGKVDPTVYRDGIWWIYQSSSGRASAANFGLSGDRPVLAA